MNALYLGIDPGTVATGYALVRDGQHGPELVECGVCKMPARAPLWDRLRVMRDDLDGLIERWRQEHQLGGVAVERPFVRGGYGKSAAPSPRSAITVGAGFGVALCCVAGWAAHCKAPFIEVAPATVKATLAGSGRADKAAMQAAAVRVLGMGAMPPADAADAIGVSVCAMRHRLGTTSSGVPLANTPQGRFPNGCLS